MPLLRGAKVRRLVISVLCLHVLWGLQFDPTTASVSGKALAGFLCIVPTLCLTSLFYGRNEVTK
ncbi:hypothetical protein GCM10008955_00720 [Deinococcus malanensis]|uniref:Uncharacterized protein n=1 Tax=Deinococcus malanensis TaxID=1706855 RepID=A0ABQ2EGX5_9DEIO|nr:hypothetical protein GCM10008955_00720 [Deinococcus malanensis]